MTREEKIEVIAEILEIEEDEVTDELVLNDLETWDSVAVLSVISVINAKFDRYPQAKEIAVYKTVGELMEAFE